MMKLNAFQFSFKHEVADELERLIIFFHDIDLDELRNLAIEDWNDHYCEDELGD